MEVTKVMDELQRLLSGSAIGLQHGRHEDEAVGVALAELLLSTLQVVAQPLMLGCMSGIGSCLAYPWLVAVAARMGDGDVKHHVGAHVREVPDDDILEIFSSSKTQIVAAVWIAFCLKTGYLDEELMELSGLHLTPTLEL